MKFNIYDHNHKLTIVDPGEINTISSISVQTLSGDQVLCVKYKDGNQKHFDSSNSRIFNFDDGGTVIYDVNNKNLDSVDKIDNNFVHESVGDTIVAMYTDADRGANELAIVMEKNNCNIAAVNKNNVIIHKDNDNMQISCTSNNIAGQNGIILCAISDINPNTIGGTLAVLGRKPEDNSFWNDISLVEKRGLQAIETLPIKERRKVSAFYNQISKMKNSCADKDFDVTDKIEKVIDALDKIIDEKHPEHQRIINDGIDWEKANFIDKSFRSSDERRPEFVFGDDGISFGEF